jgi:hypothetical protein
MEFLRIRRGTAQTRLEERNWGRTADILQRLFAVETFQRDRCVQVSES